jgi:hypothetical protein
MQLSWAMQASGAAAAGSPGLGNADRGVSGAALKEYGLISRAGYLHDTGKPLGGFWTVEYYQCYFDVDTKTVLRRCYGMLLPSSAD